MLEEKAMTGDESIVSWQPHGKAFRVHQPNAFASIVMPQYFKQQKKYKSFQRQLNIYGFRRIGKGMDAGAYFHPMFIRNQKSMSLRMSCQKIKGNHKSTNKVVDDHAAGDPDFYSQDMLNVLDNNLTNALQPVPILLESSTARTNENTGSSDHQLLTGAEEVMRGATGPSPPHQPIDWMDQSQTLLSWEKELTSLYNGYDNPVPEKSKDVSALLSGVIHHQKLDDEGFFQGNRFFGVAETKTPMMDDFSTLVNRRGPMLPTVYMPRSA
jgi:hypothetical protein